jgi:hypothetical protein
MTLWARRRPAFGAAVMLALAGHALALAIVGGLLSPPRGIVEQQHAVLWLAAPPRPPATTPSPPLPIDARMRSPEPAPPTPSMVSGMPAAPDTAPPVPGAAPVAAAIDAAAPSDRLTVTPDQLAKYLPASALTRRALIAEPIALDYKALDASVVRGGSARFIVLISDEGRVDLVVIENSTLNPGFQSFAR